MPEYSDGLVLTWCMAGEEAGRTAHVDIKPGHFFVALCQMCDLSLTQLAQLVGMADEQEVRRRFPLIEAEIDELRQAFGQTGLEVRSFRRRLRALLGSEGRLPADGKMHRSPEARRLFEHAEGLCANSGGRRVRPGHLLWALCSVENSPWSQVLGEVNVKQAALLGAIAGLAGRPELSEKVPAEATSPGRGAVTPAAEPGRRATPLLDRYGRDLTRLAREGKLRPVIGREEEIREVGRVLLRHQRNNAILVGDAGVGKTCVVEAFAQRIASDKVSDFFRNKRIVEISMGLLVAGTKYRGEFEERLQSILAEASSHPDLILFIDEIHTAMGAGAAAGDAVDAANLMKPALSRGDIRCIGATTTNEFRRYIERDTSFQRRFQVIWIDEPTRQEAIAILQGLRPSFEQHHGFSITDSAITAAVELSMRYAPELRLPDKAIDLVDEACARARLRSFTALDRPSSVDRQDVAQVAAQRYRVPIERLTVDEATRLLTMADALRRRVKGQEDAIAAICETVRAARAGLTPPNRPQGVFLFLGPTGTGKTELAKALAEFLFDDENALITFDMSEYAERHTVSRLIGAPPGYIGHDEEGQLTGPIRNRPYSVVLLDEIEKAHPDVHRLFLQVFDEGRLTDSTGRHASFRDAVIIMTSNLGTFGAGSAKRIGIDLSENAKLAASSQNQERIMEAVRSVLPPEFLNRIQKIVFFNPLDRQTVREIVDKILVGFCQQIASHSLTLELDESAYDLLMAEGFDEKYGARAMERSFHRLLAEPLGRLIIEGRVADGTHLLARAEQGQMRFDRG